MSSYVDMKIILECNMTYANIRFVNLWCLSSSISSKKKLIAYNLFIYNFLRKHIDANGKTSITLMKHSEMKMSQKCFYLFPIKDQLPLMNTALTSGVLFRTALVLTLFRIGGGAKRLSTNFSTGFSTNVGITAKTLLRLVLTIFPDWCKMLRSYLVPVSSYWTWTKTTPQKTVFFWSNPYKVEVMMTFS